MSKWLVVAIGCGAIAYLGAVLPWVLAIIVAVFALAAGLSLEEARLRHEYPFYFGVLPERWGEIYVQSWALIASGLKAVLAALLALLFFSGAQVPGEVSRVDATAIAFGSCLFVGSFILIRMQNRFVVNPARWGYFRLALPLGFLFSLVLHTAPIFLMWLASLFDSNDNGWTFVSDAFRQAVSLFWGDACSAVHGKWSVVAASDCYFQLLQQVDALVELVLTAIGLPDIMVFVLQILGSTYLAMGLVLAPLTISIVYLASRASSSTQSR